MLPPDEFLENPYRVIHSWIISLVFMAPQNSRKLQSGSNKGQSDKKIP